MKQYNDTPRSPLCRLFSMRLRTLHVRRWQSTLRSQTQWCRSSCHHANIWMKNSTKWLPTQRPSQPT